MTLSSPLPDARAAQGLPSHSPYGLFANGDRAANVARARELLAMDPPTKEPEAESAGADALRALPHPCPCCGGRMIVIETFARGCTPKHRPSPTAAAIRIDTS